MSDKTSTQPRANGSRQLNWRNIIKVGSLTILVAVEVIGAAIAGGWAVAGLLELGTTLEYAFMALFTAIAIWAMVRFVGQAVSVESLTRK